MKTRTIAIVFLAGVLAGCMGSGPPIAAQSPPPLPGGTPADRSMGVNGLGIPLVIDRTDVRIGTTVQFDRIPNAGELHDATETPGLAHVVVSLPDWPASYEPLQVFDQLTAEVDIIVVLPGYPPSRAAAQIWNYVSARLRIIAVVPGPPEGPNVIADLNTMRGLERVIAQMDDPSRRGFEQLQRPLSFRKLVQ